MRDIENIGDIRILVDAFYSKVREDNLLAPVFATRITDWQPHLNTMYRFWNAALFQVREYVGNPMTKHITLPVDGPHFEQWINLFYETLDQHFEGPVADEAKQRAMIMAHTFYQRIHNHHAS
ncbi:MAG: group III truncated hemoglobin [Chryseolinea sp.]